MVRGRAEKKREARRESRSESRRERRYRGRDWGGTRGGRADTWGRGKEEVGGEEERDRRGRQGEGERCGDRGGEMSREWGGKGWVRIGRDGDRRWRDEGKELKTA